MGDLNEKEKGNQGKIFTIALGNGKKWKLRAAEDATIEGVWYYIKPVVPKGIFAIISTSDETSRPLLKGVD